MMRRRSMYEKRSNEIVMLGVTFFRVLSIDLRETRPYYEFPNCRTNVQSLWE
jgi:hypothetical protein